MDINLAVTKFTLVLELRKLALQDVFTWDNQVLQKLVIKVNIDIYISDITIIC